MLLEELGLEAAQGVAVLAGCPKLVRTPPAHARSVVSLLLSCGFTHAEVLEIIRGWPPVLVTK